MKKAQPKAWLLVLTISLGTLLNPLNSSMISIGLTRIQHEFTLSFTDVSWLISIFYLASAVGQPITGKLSDMFGPKRLFLMGLVLVVIPCVLAPFSPNYGFLLGCRAVQAIGSSTLFPSGMSMIRTYITEKQARSIAIITIFSSTSAAFGPALGGFLIANWSWEAIFIVNIPVIFIAFILAVLILPNNSKVQIDWKKVDFIGIVLFTIFIISLILFLLSLKEQIKWWAFFVFIGTGIYFYYYEKSRVDPFIDVVSLKKDKNVTIVYIQFMFINFIHYNFFFGFPTFFQQARGYSEELSGLIMLALAGFGVITTPFAGRLIDHRGSRLAMIIGAFILLTGTGLLFLYTETSPLLWLVVILAILGVSNGFANISAQTALYENVKAEDTGSSSGLFQTSRYLGSILSGSFLGITFNSYVQEVHLRTITTTCFIVCIIVVFLAFKLPNKMKRLEKTENLKSVN